MTNIKLNYNRIKEMLAKQNKTNIELARYIRISGSTVSNWCTNTTQPEMRNLYMIAEFLEVEAGELLTLRKNLAIVRRKKRKL